jgi:hypothetical protein
MLRALTLALVFGVFAGLGGQVLAQVGLLHADCVATEQSCDGHGHDVSHEHSEEGDHGPHCPPGPHHHHHHVGACCGGMLVMVDPEICRLGATPGLRTTWHHPDEAMPDGPVLTMDKPPQI